MLIKSQFIITFGEAMFKLFILSCLIASQLTCPKGGKIEPKEKQIRRAAYYWKREFKLNPEEQARLKDNQINTLYVKLFEVGGNYNGNWPHADIQMSAKLENLEIVPVVFISPSVLEDYNTETIKGLAKKIMSKAGCTPELNVAGLGPNRPFKELQIDCDWHKNDKETYFAFLRQLKQINPKLIISTTLRLYPFKYPETMGVPPVDRCMLMPYNLTAPDKVEGETSIYKKSLAGEYFTKKEYPISLDIAIPTFGWLKKFREGKFSRLYTLKNNKFPKELLTYTEKTEKGWRMTKEYQGQIDGNWMYFDKGDMLYMDYPKKEDLLHLAKESRSLLAPNTSVSLFSVDDFMFNAYSTEEINEVFENYK